MTENDKELQKRTEELTEEIFNLYNAFHEAEKNIKQITKKIQQIMNLTIPEDMTLTEYQKELAPNKESIKSCIEKFQATVKYKGIKKAKKTDLVKQKYELYAIADYIKTEILTQLDNVYKENKIQAKASTEGFIPENHILFANTIDNLRIERKLKVPDVETAVNVWHRMLNAPGKQCYRDDIIASCFIMKIHWKETENILALAGQPYNSGNIKDKAIKDYWTQDENVTIWELKELLEKKGIEAFNRLKK